MDFSSVGYMTPILNFGLHLLPKALVDAIDEAATYNHLFIVAAGNDGRDNEITATYPCNYNRPNMICVASTDSANDISSFSNLTVGYSRE